MGPRPGPGRLGQRRGGLRRAGADGADKQARTGGADAVWPPEAPVAPRSPGPRPAASPAGSSRALPRTGPRPETAAAPPETPAGGAMAGCEELSVRGFEEFSRAVERHRDKTIFAYFTGSKDAGGQSWCPDCVQGEAGSRAATGPAGAGKRRTRGPGAFPGPRPEPAHRARPRALARAEERCSPGAGSGPACRSLQRTGSRYRLPWRVGAYLWSFTFSAEPVVREGLKHLSEGCVFIYCQVGEKP